MNFDPKQIQQNNNNNSVIVVVSIGYRRIAPTEHVVHVRTSPREINDTYTTYLCTS